MLVIPYDSLYSKANRGSDCLQFPERKVYTSQELEITPPLRSGRPPILSRILDIKGGGYSSTGRMTDSGPAGQIFGSDLVIVMAILGPLF